MFGQQDLIGHLSGMWPKSHPGGSGQHVEVQVKDSLTSRRLVELLYQNALSVKCLTNRPSNFLNRSHKRTQFDGLCVE